MDIAQFELLFKPQAPGTPIGSGAVATVIQGFFLEISNLEDKEFRFAVNFVAPEPDPATPNAAFRSLAGNTQTFVDVPSADNDTGVLNGRNGLYSPSSGLVRIPPQATALVAVLPSVFPSPLDPTPIGSPVFEVRGYVRLRLPPVLTFVPPFFFNFAPQGDSPVRVMVTAQNRTTYFDEDGNITDQTQASLPICEGKACLEIEPEPAFAFPTLPALAENQPAPGIAAEAMIARGDSDRLGMELAGMLKLIDPEKGDLRSFNAALKKAEIPFAIERRKS